MKLTLLKQQLIEKNALKPNLKKVSSLREEYKEELKNFYEKEPVLKTNITEIVNSALSAVNYQKSNNLTSLPQLNSISVNNPVEEQNNVLDKLKIIGITGSKGKSTTAYIVHEYLKSLGYRSVLYSSIKIDSPASYISANDPCEVALQSEQMLLNILEEAEAIKADFLVLEINESVIEKKLIEGIPFTVRALTNLNPKHNEEHYSPEEYIQLKESFFKNIPKDEDCTCVYGLTEGINRESFNHLIQLNSHPKVTFGTKYTCERHNADYTNLDCLLYELQSDLNGLEMKIRVKENLFNFNSKLLFSHNAFNFTCAIAILEALNLLDVTKFNRSIESIEIPGREEIIKIGNRTIVIGLSVIPSLKDFNQFKKNLSQINDIKVVIGSTGSGFISWDKAYSSVLYLKNRSSNRKYAMEYIKNYANYVYLTSNDPAAENPINIAQEMQSYLKNDIPSTIEVNREKAIKNALEESKPNDLIYIAGRGNRSIFCETKYTVKIFRDKDVVLKVVGELGWK